MRAPFTGGVQGGHGWATALVLVSFAVGVVTADAAGALLPSPLQESALAAPVIVTPRPFAVRATATAVLTVRTDGARTITSPRAGTVTSVAVAPDTTVDSGELVASVDGAPLLAYTAPYPFYRDLGPGVRGDDVVVLRGFLRTVGQHVPEAGTTFDSAVGRAVNAWRASIGLSRGTAVPRQSLVWLGPEPARVGQVGVRLGDRVDQGSALFQIAEVATAIEVVEGARSGWDGVDAAATLTIGGVQVPYRAGSGLIAQPEHVVAVAEQLGANPKATATIESVSGTSVLALPAGAVLTDRAGRTCVLLEGRPDPAAVVVLGGTVGTVFVAPGGHLADARVVARPDVGKDFPGCG